MVLTTSSSQRASWGVDLTGESFGEALDGLPVPKDRLVELFMNELFGRPDPQVVMPGRLGSETNRSICSIIERRLELVAQGSTGALNPGPVVDAVLGRLVQMATTDFRANISGSSQQREQFHWGVVEALCRRIDEGVELADRAMALRRGAGAAETLMESHYARCLVADPISIFTPGDSLERIRRLRFFLDTFPYTSNYEALTRSEIDAVSLFGSPQRVAFCGAGALPLTAVFFHLFTGASVTAIEIDSAAAALASTVIADLVRCGVIEEGAVEVMVADAAMVDLISFDLIILASLLENSVVSAIASRLVRSSTTGGPLVLVRSARGLVARIAYDPVPLEVIECHGFSHLGTIAPKESVSRAAVVDNSLGIAATSSKLLTIAPREVLNTSELFALSEP